VSDLYRVLGVGRGATKKEIHRAYRRGAKISHPDSGGSVEAFSELGTAYAVLSDAERRELYDRTGEIRLPRPDTLDASAIEIIAQKLGLILHAEQDVTSMDIAALLEQTIRDDIDERKAGMSGLRRAMERAKKLRDRVKRKAQDQDNMLARVLDWHESTAKNNIKKNEEAIGSMQRALEILKDYSFAEDLPLANADDVSEALHDALKALDELAVMLNANQPAPEAILGEARPTAFG
jgi:curved DNA-binding protein CbpA